MNATAPAVRSHAAWGLAAYADAHGKIEEAHKWLRLVWDSDAPYSRQLFPHNIASDAEVVRVGLAVGDDELVTQALASAVERERHNPEVSSISACVHHLRGLATHSSDELSYAVRLMRHAGRPLALACLLEDYGCSLVEDGATQEGVRALNEALETAVSIGATRVAGRVRGRLRELGVRRRILPSTAAHNGWDALTPTESQVAELVVAGCTNREISEQLFISPHTVNTHVRHIFDKVQVRSRFELARLAGQQDHDS